ncbi:MAG: hypothetical protein J5679_01980 [Alphaproteobacteria bacterium]|nr:hypothetical protein [Alphaproteobacteria bacterium]
MKLSKKMFYKIKRLIPMMGLAGLTTLPIACEDPEQEAELLAEAKRGFPGDKDSTTTKTDTTNNVSVPFSTHEFTQIFGDELVQYIQTFIATIETQAKDSTVDTIYMVPNGNWEDVDKIGIFRIRDLFLQPATEISPKVHGRGDFNFKLGEATKTPADSLWFTEKGWTINKKYHGIPRDIEIKFNRDNHIPAITNYIPYFTNDSTVRAIYLVPEGHWTDFNHYTIPSFRTFLQQQVELSPKIHGRGDFDFKLGEASKVPQDSIWITQQGWTINKAYQNNQNQK